MLFRGILYERSTEYMLVRGLGGGGVWAANCLATPTYVDHTPYYITVYLVTYCVSYKTNVVMSLYFILGRREVHPCPPAPAPPPLDETLLGGLITIVIVKNLLQCTCWPFPTPCTPIER